MIPDRPASLGGLAFAEEEHDGDVVHLVTDPRRSRTHRLKPLPLAVLRACDGEHDVAAIADAVSEVFETEIEVPIIVRCLEQLEALELLEGAEERARPVSYGRRIGQLAARHPDRPALIHVAADGSERSYSWADFDRKTTQLARLFAERGVDEKSMVVVGLPNGPEHLVALFAAWKLGALALPMRAILPARERDDTLALARPKVVVADWEGIAWPSVPSSIFASLDGYSDAPLPDRVPRPGKSIGSGGSTGRPKIVVEPSAWERVPADTTRVGPMGLRSGQVQLVLGPLYHNAPFTCAVVGLFEAHTVITMDRLDAARAVDLIERHRVNFICAAPTIMKRVIEVPSIRERDLSSLEGLFHTGAPCAAWLKRAWIDLVGGERIFEGFGGSEAVGATLIRGDEWLAHPGSVGKPTDTEVLIADEAGQPVPTRAVGEIFMRWRDPSVPTYEYVGAQAAKSLGDRWVSLGDMGFVDEEGYLYLADRRVDMIISGGENIYPAEIEAPLTEHPAVADVVIIGLPDEEWGKRVHAIVQPRDPAAPPSREELDRHCRAHVAAYKVPKSYEFVDEIPRDAAGKVRRRDLIDARVARPA